jgi:hypothetical protein
MGLKSIQLDGEGENETVWYRPIDRVDQVNAAGQNALLDLGVYTEVRQREGGGDKRARGARVIERSVRGR